jgi:pSer/pThr/pTyr-binding forkhead associated (FHA) protein
MQVIISITRDLRRTAAVNEDALNRLPPFVGHLIVVDSGPSTLAPGTSFNLNPQTTIGRGPTNTIQINESFVSAEHTRVWYRNGTWYVQDAGSTNGTYLNNQPARDALPARVGDIIQVGFLRFKLTQ